MGSYWNPYGLSAESIGVIVLFVVEQCSNESRTGLERLLRSKSVQWRSSLVLRAFCGVLDEDSFTMPMMSLHGFCQIHGLPKSSVHTYLTKKLNFDLSRGMSMQAQEVALAEFTTARTEASPSPEVSGGGGASRVSLPSSVSSVDLSQFRGDQQSSALSQPDTFFNNLCAFLGEVEAGMEVAEECQMIELTDARALRRRGTARLAAFRRRASEHRLRTEMIGLLQDQEFEDLQSISEEIEGMGKPMGGGN